MCVFYFVRLESDIGAMRRRSSRKALKKTQVEGTNPQTEAQRVFLNHAHFSHGEKFGVMRSAIAWYMFGCLVPRQN